jgi:hypothetical protein
MVVVEEWVEPTPLFGALGEALGVARLWCVGVHTMEFSTEELGRTADSVETVLARRDRTTIADGARTWLNFDNAIRAFLREAERDLASRTTA